MTLGVAIYLTIRLEISEEIEKEDKLLNYDECFQKEVTTLLRKNYNCTVLHVFNETDNLPLCNDSSSATNVILKKISLHTVVISRSAKQTMTK